MLGNLQESGSNKIKLCHEGFSMIHLGFDPDLWGELMADYVINRMKCNIDFSVVHDNNDDMYSRFIYNLPKYLLTEIIDVKVAIKDFCCEEKLFVC